MFSLASGIYQSYFAPPKLSVLLIGLDDSGKTALLERIKVTSVESRDQSTRSSGGRKPARLPPPLPPKKAARSQRVVAAALASSDDGQADEAARGAQETRVKWGQSKSELSALPPPPPFLPDRPGDAAAVEEPSEPRPPVAAPRKDASGLNLSPGRFIQLLRCPSPKRYSAAGLQDEDDECEIVSPQESDDEDEDCGGTDHLARYFIDYKDKEEFDVKRNAKMFPLDKIRPTLGQNLAKLDLAGCKCSLFDLSGADKMRPLWERYYQDTDAIIYVVDSVDASFPNILESRRQFQQMCQNQVIQKRIQTGLPILIFANKLDLAYREYQQCMSNQNKHPEYNRAISWNNDEEDQFVGQNGSEAKHDTQQVAAQTNNRVMDFHDLVSLFGLQPLSSLSSGDGSCVLNVPHGVLTIGQVEKADSICKDNIFLFGGSAKTGEGVCAAVEYLTIQAKKYHLSRNAR